MEEKNKIKQKQMVLMFIGIMILLVSITGITFAFFNYTKTGGANVIKTGNIEFNMTQGKTISLQNVFPITSTEALADSSNTSVCEIVITGRNTYAGGVEYLVSSANTNISADTIIDGQTKKVDVPVSLIVNVENNGNGANDNLGTSDDNYFKNRDHYVTSHYKKITGDSLTGDQLILVGYIASSASTNNSINGKITLIAYFDKNKMIITDTPDETNTGNKTVMSTSEWNSFNSEGVSFQVKVEAREGIWVTGSLEEIMKNESLGVDTNLGVDFSTISNLDGLDGKGTKGVYLRAGTQNVTGSYPVYYYRGNVNNNNVIFNNLCWKAIRTTETGGVKLLYNGHPESTYIDDNYDLSIYKDVVKTGNQFEFDSVTNEWTVTLTVPSTGGNSGQANLSFKVSTAGDYILKYYYPNSGPFTVTRNGTSLGYSVTGFNTKELNNLGTDEVINIAYTHSNAPSSSVVMTVALTKGQISSVGCNNDANDSVISLNVNGVEKNKFEYGNNMWPAYVGYMYGDVYELSGAAIQSYYDNTFVWDGTKYIIGDSAVNTLSNNAHYACDSVYGKQCSTIKYHIKNNSAILLTGGVGIEEAIIKMQTNTNDSVAKEIIEDWFSSSMTQVLDKLEDGIYCNDRSMNDTNGWNINGGDLNEDLNYGGALRILENEIPEPSLSCPRKNDSFTVSSRKGNQKLNYPVGMITIDEAVLAGGKYGFDNNSLSSYYLRSGKEYWTMSPKYINSGAAQMFGIGNNGNFYNSGTNQTNGLRPVITLKKGIIVQSGTGRINNPYVIS